DICSLILSIRKKANIKVRQPLQKILIPVLNENMKEQIRKMEEVILSEVNVKQIEYITDSDGFIKKKIKPNFKVLGAKMGAKMKAVAAAIQQLSDKDISLLEKNGVIDLRIGEDTVTLNTEDVEISAEDVPGWSVAGKNQLTVALDITITPDLQEEGNARELVNRIQKIRKESGFELTDRIVVNIQEYEPLKSSIINFSDYIC